MNNLHATVQQLSFYAMYLLPYNIFVLKLDLILISTLDTFQFKAHLNQTIFIHTFRT